MRPGGSLISGIEFMVSNLFLAIAGALCSGWSKDGSSPYNKNPKRIGGEDARSARYCAGGLSQLEKHYQKQL
jgi:hypothetical protein